MRLIAVFSVLLLLMTGCSLLQKQVQKPTAEVKGVELRALSLESATLVMLVDIENPNPISLPIAGFDYSFDLMNSPFLSGNNRQKTNLKASGTTRIEVPVEVAFVKMYESVKNTLDASEVPYGFQAAVILDLPVIGPTRLNAKYQDKLPVPKLPKISVESAGLQNVSLSSVELDLKFKLENPNVFDVKMEKIHYNFKADGKTWASTNQAKSVTATAGKSTTLSMPVKLKFSDIGSALYAKMLNKNTKFNSTVEGESVIKAVHPLLGEMQIPLELAGKMGMK